MFKNLIITVMGFDQSICNTGLSLSLACHEHQQNNFNHQYQSDHHDQNKKRLSSEYNDHMVLSLTLGLPQDLSTPQIEKDVQPQVSSPSAVSSFSNECSVKKERSEVGFGGSDEDEEGSPRKKLRLTKQQSAVLEDNFKEHSTLNPKQKQALAEKLNLRPRQVEVWFQNRRARTKLKQTEVDCELLKKCCEKLTEENKKLVKELQELKALKQQAAQLNMQLPAATLDMCPSCEKISNGNAGDGLGGCGGSSTSSITVGGRPRTHFCRPFNHSSAAY